MTNLKLNPQTNNL